MLYQDYCSNTPWTADWWQFCNKPISHTHTHTQSRGGEDKQEGRRRKRWGGYWGVKRSKGSTNHKQGKWDEGKRNHRREGGGRRWREWARCWDEDFGRVTINYCEMRIQGGRGSVQWQKKMNKKQREAKGFCDGGEYEDIKRFKVESCFTKCSSGEQKLEDWRGKNNI